MQNYLKRNIEGSLKQYMEIFPVTAVLGPRQCGKSTLVRQLAGDSDDFVYLDLQNDIDLEKLRDPYYFFEVNKAKTVCLDEIQNTPEIFRVMRSVIDNDRRTGRFIILGSASRDLIRQSSETLAGRIGYLEMVPFVFSELKEKFDFNRYWLRGGFPENFLAQSDIASLVWRKNFIRTFLERDIPLFGNMTPSNSIGRLWSMCAHIHGQTLNLSKLGDSLGVTHPTVRSYIDILEQTFMVRTLKPYEANIGKRLVKSPKIYIRDTGILHALLNINEFNDLLGHIVFGESWKGLVIENILAELPDWNGYFYRTSTGNEIDLVIEYGNKKIAVECKASMAPNIPKGFFTSMGDLKITEGYVIAPVKESYPVSKEVSVMPLWEFIEKMR